MEAVKELIVGLFWDIVEREDGEGGGIINNRFNQLAPIAHDPNDDLVIVAVVDRELAEGKNRYFVFLGRKN